MPALFASSTLRRIVIVSLIVAASTSSLAHADDQPPVIRFDRPAQHWDSQALPLGNGRLGCMVFGGIEHERVQFNENSLWTGGENPSGDYGSMGAYQDFGSLWIDLANPDKRKDDRKNGAPPGYERTLTLADGVNHVRFTHSGAVHTRTMFASHPHEVIVLRWTADHPGAVSGTIRLQGAHDDTTHAENNDLYFAGKLSNGLLYKAQVRVIAKGGKVETKKDAIECSGCDEVLILLAAGTNYMMDYASGWRGDDPAARLARQLDEAAAAGYDKLLADHIADHQSLFGRVDVAWGQSPENLIKLPTPRRLELYRAGGDDPQLEATLFQLGRYLLMSSSRRPGLPANLQGLWNDSNHPAWSSDYHTNINVQMNYWPVEVANLGPCALPLFDLVMAMREPSRKATQASFGKVRGWTARTSHNIFGGHGWEWNIPSSAWYALHFWEHYAFSGDKKFLRDTAYPMTKEVCEFWVDHLKKLPDGTYVVPNGWSPEHGPREDGVSHDQQIVWQLFTVYLKMADDLGVDHEFRGQIAAIRDHLAGPKIGRWGQLQEWMTDRDDPNDHHRHTSHLFAVFPGTMISRAKTPELAQAAAVSLKARGTSGDSRREWAWAWRCNLWARLHDGEHAYDMLHNLLLYNTLDNLFGVHPPMQLDGNFGITAGMCEMLLQSHDGAIDLLPALPKKWASGHFRGLWARGGVEVDLVWHDGKPTAGELRCTLDGPVTLRSETQAEIHDVAGHKVAVQHHGNETSFAANAGGRYTLTFR